jgi:parallel beta-helix repeat protein
VYVHNSSATISSNIIERNTASEGGGIFSYTASCKVINNTIIGNFSNNGGGMFCADCPSVLISGNSIKHDTSVGSGAGIVCDQSNIIISSNDIIGTVSLMNGPSYGGGVSCRFCSGTIEDNYISGNIAEYGGGIISNFCTFDIIGNLLQQNTGLGAICSWMDISTTITNNIVTDNYWLGIYIWEGASITIANNTISEDWYGGIFLEDAPSTSISNNIISNVLNGWGIKCESTLGAEISHNDLWNNPQGAFSGCESNLGDTTWGENLNGIPCDSFYNIFRDPMYTDPQAGDFHLSNNSPCIDAGNNFAPNLPPVDFDGSPRIVDGNEDDSAVVDMGAFEYHLDRGDVNQDGVINIADVIYLINYLFIGGLAPSPLWIGDVNCDGAVDIGDVIYLINYLFCSGPAPC